MEKQIKLELKHIKGYLDHGLKCNYKAGMHYGDDCLVLGADLEGLKVNMPLLWLRYEYVKPILKRIEFLRDDENFELYLDLCEELGVVHCNNMLIALEEENYFAIDVQKEKEYQEAKSRVLFEGFEYKMQSYDLETLFHLGKKKNEWFLEHKETKFRLYEEYFNDKNIEILSNYHFEFTLTESSKKQIGLWKMNVLV